VTTKKGFVHLLPIVLILVALIVGGYFLYTKVLKPKTEAPKVQLHSTYENPFDKSAQYINPFVEFKDPFDTAPTKSK